jgi:hypothetical protein
MEDSARRADIPLKLDRRKLRAALREMALEAGFGDVRFRITVPRESPDIFILTLEPYTPPTSELLQTGIRVITAPDSARENPAAKTTGWMHNRQALQASLPSRSSSKSLRVNCRSAGLRRILPMGRVLQKRLSPAAVEALFRL